MSRLPIASTLGTLMLVAVMPLAAQKPTLDRVETEMHAGALASAREILDAWWSLEGEKASDAALARGLLLRGMLDTDAELARDSYLAVILEHPGAVQVPEALLRLGQGELAAGDAESAIRHLTRLSTDFPSSAQAAAARLWAARSRIALGDTISACDALREADKAGTPKGAAGDEIRDLVRAELQRFCAPTAPPGGSGAAGAETAAAEPVAASPVRAPTPAPTPTRAPAPAAPRPVPPAAASPSRPAAAAAAAGSSRAPTPATSRYAIQSGAFRDAAGARSVAARVRKLGYTPRLVRIGDGTLIRVRVGRFAARAEAAAAARVIAGAGLEAYVVDDVAAEVPADR